MMVSPELPSRVSGAIESVMRSYFSRFPRNRVDVMAEEWDDLLLLDACRYDAFAAVDGSDGLESRLSRGSSTGEFFAENFAGTEHADTVYVTANPVPRVDDWCPVDVDSVFFEVVDVWEDHWDEDANTVRPGPVADAIVDAHRTYPDKRILGHFVQPHQPFIGETGRTIESVGMTAVEELSGGESSGRKVWDRIEAGATSAERAWQAYVENLELVLPHVRRLCRELPGKTVVTSDHGNLFGEFAWPFPVRMYGHPEGIHTRKLITVPWLECESGDRRAVTSEPSVADEPDPDDAELLDRLRKLGYR